MGEQRTPRALWQQQVTDSTGLPSCPSCKSTTAVPRLHLSDNTHQVNPKQYPETH